MIILSYIFICVLGWFFGMFANEIIEWEIKGEGDSLPPSQILKRVHLPWIAVKFCAIIAILYIYCSYGNRVEGFGVFLFIFALIIISVIDLYTMRIPNRINLILAGIHGLFIVLGWSVSWGQALLGALLGGGVLLGIRYLSLVILKKEGMGMGDIKLALVCGLYLGPVKVLFGLLIAVYIAGFILLVLLLMRKIKRNQYIPYGPFLAGGFVISLLFFDDIIKLLWWI